VAGAARASDRRALPTGAETKVPMIVTVTEDAKTGGQIWIRSAPAATDFRRSFTRETFCRSDRS